jgi:hypothetical protein
MCSCLHMVFHGPETNALMGGLDDACLAREKNGVQIKVGRACITGIKSLRVLGQDRPTAVYVGSEPRATSFSRCSKNLRATKCW